MSYIAIFDQVKEFQEIFDGKPRFLISMTNIHKKTHVSKSKLLTFINSVQTKTLENLELLTRADFKVAAYLKRYGYSVR